MADKSIAKITVPFANCLACHFFENKHAVSVTKEGVEITCDIEPICRNAVHIAWESLSEEEQQLKIQRSKYFRCRK